MNNMQGDPNGVFFSYKKQEPTLGDGYIVHIKLGFLVSIFSVVIAIVAIFISLRADVVKMLDIVAKHDVILQDDQHSQTLMQMQINSIDLKLQNLKDQYEEDRKFIRQ